MLSMLRAAESGVPHDIGAAYAILASRTGQLLDAMEAGRLALAPDDATRHCSSFATRDAFARFPTIFRRKRCAMRLVFRSNSPPFDSARDARLAQGDDRARPSTTALRPPLRMT